MVDYGNHRVQLFNATGGYVDQFGTHGNGTGQFWRPTGIAWSPGGDRIAVVDFTKLYLAHHRVQLFDATGGFVDLFGSYGNGTGQFKWPNGIAWSPGGDRIAVADTHNGRVQLFNATGGYVGEFGGPDGKGPFGWNPRHVAWSPLPP